MTIKQFYGLTVFEILICLAIMACLLAIGIPLWFSQSESLLASAKAHELRQLIYFARSTAVLSGSTVVICPLGHGLSCGKDWSAGIMLYQPIRSSSDVLESPLRVVSGNPNRYRLRFKGFTSERELTVDPNGRVKQNGRFYYTSTHSSQHWTLIVSRAGRVRLVTGIS